MQLDQLDVKGMFQHAQVSGAKESVLHSKKEAAADVMAGIVYGSAPVTQTVTYEKPGREDASMAISDIRQQASMKDAVQQKNEMLFGVNQMNEKTAQGMSEDGFFVLDTDLPTIVTETDKIQAKLTRAGVDTSYFSDEPSMEQLEAIAGSQALAREYARVFAQASDLHTMDEGSMKYMLEQELSPTIENLYVAQYNGVAQSVQPDASFEDPGILSQIQQVVLAAGLTPNAKTIDAGKWMAANDLAVTPERISAWNTLQGLQLPASEEHIVTAMAEAVAEGREPAEAYLAESASLMSRAKESSEVLESVTEEDLAYVLDRGQELTIENLRSARNLREAGAINTIEAEGLDASDATDTSFRINLIEARRILEETRLVMTIEANYALLRRGIQIDTRPLAQLVEQLREQENSYYKQLLEADGTKASSEQVELFSKTQEVALDLRTMPAYALGSAEYTGNLESLQEAGAVLERKLMAAGEAYETLMSTPRADLGDSMQKAFRNVDAILTDIGLEATDENARAVRILAYNEMEITKTSVTGMKLADLQVQEAFESLKPAVVREMIRRDINPLKMDITELNEQANNIRSQIGGADDLTKYSEYLWKLEHSNSISQEERDAYIGIYRLINQVEQKDGAAVGALVQQGLPITMENLLRAMRSSRKSGMNYSVDDSFGGVDRVNNGTAIDEQILAAYQSQCLHRVQELSKEPQQFSQLLGDLNWQELTPEELLLHMQEEQADMTQTTQVLERMQEAAGCSAGAYEMLDAYSIPVTANHVLTMQQMLSTPNDALRRLFGLDERINQMEDTDQKEALLQEIAAAKEDILKKIGDNAHAPEELAKAQETLAEVAEHCGQTFLREGMSALDVRQFLSMRAQLQLGAQLAREERYQIPLITGDTLTGVNVRIIRSDEKKGRVRITMDSDAYGKVAGELQTTEDGIKGYFACDSRAGADQLEQQMDRLCELLTEDGQAVDNEHIPVIYSGHLDLVHFELAEASADLGARGSGMLTSQLYGLAEKVILFLGTES